MASAGIDAKAGADHDPCRMNELAALTAKVAHRPGFNDVDRAEVLH